MIRYTGDIRTTYKFEGTGIPQKIFSIDNVSVENVFLRVSDPNILITFAFNEIVISFTINDLYNSGFGQYVENVFFVQQYDTAKSIYCMFVRFVPKIPVNTLTISLTANNIVEYAYLVLYDTEKPHTTPKLEIKTIPTQEAKEKQVLQVTLPQAPVNLLKKEIIDRRL